MIEKPDIKASKLIRDLQDIDFTTIIVVIVGSWLCIWLFNRLLPYLANHGPSRLRHYMLGAIPLLRLGILILAFLWIMPLIFNITFQNFIVIAGGASVAIGFAFKDLINGLIAGIVATIERPYQPGDWVEINGDYGEISDVGLRAITMVTAADDTITVPHSAIWAQNISNSNYGKRTLMCVVEFTLEPNHDAPYVKSKLYDVALTSAFLSYSQPVKIIVEQTIFGTCYKIKAYPFDLRDQFQFITDITVRAKAALRECGVREVTPPIAATDTKLQPMQENSFL